MTAMEILMKEFAYWRDRPEGSVAAPGTEIGAMGAIANVIAAIHGHPAPWHMGKLGAMDCYRTEDLLRIGMKLYRQIRDEDEAWSRKVQRGHTKFDPEIARHFRKRYEEWYAPCDAVLVLVQDMERDYGPLAGGNEFKLARVTVKRILATPIDQVCNSMERIAKGDYEAL